MQKTSGLKPDEQHTWQWSAELRYTVAEHTMNGLSLQSIDEDVEAIAVSTVALTVPMMPGIAFTHNFSQ